MLTLVQVLEQRASGRGWAKVDLTISDNQKSSFISLPDTGILRRISKRASGNPDLGNNASTNPFASFIDGSANAGGEFSVNLKRLPEAHVFFEDWSFETLLNSYQVEEVTASAATGFDISGVFPDGFSW